MAVTPFTLNLVSETTVYQREIRCHINENEFNYTMNPSAVVPNSSGSLIDNITGSEFRPYMTTVGLYNDKDELLIVGKFATPIPIPANTDMTIVVKYDF